jgi:hypothetical protein
LTYYTTAKKYEYYRKVLAVIVVEPVEPSVQLQPPFSI